MKKTLPERTRIRIAVVLMLAAPLALADDYAEARADLVAAYQAEDFVAMRDAAERALAARPDYPAAIFNLALAQTLADELHASLETLYRLLEMDVDFNVANVDEFEPLRRLPDWADYWHAVQRLQVPVGMAQVAYMYPQGDFVPEGIAMGADGEWLLGSIRHGDIVRIAGDEESPATTLATAEEAGHWSVFGMRHDGDGTLWYVSAAMDEFVALDKADAGRSGLFAIDAESGALKSKALLPATGNKQVLGDLVLADDDTIYLADQADGVVYRHSKANGEFAVVLERGALHSPQGLVLDESGEHLYVADYVGGIHRVSIDGGDAMRVQPLNTASDYGIDGLYRRGNTLIAIQNGIRPNRVVAFELAPDGLSIVSSRILAMNLPEFDDPNLGQVVGDDFYFIANSHWPRFDREFNLPEGLSGPIIMKVRIH